jgi:hypothetical protein
MFIEPEKHILVAITKIKFFQNIITPKKLMRAASGEGRQKISLKGHKIVLVEQDQPETMKDLIKVLVEEVGDIKGSCKCGWIQPVRITSIIKKEENDSGDINGYKRNLAKKISRSIKTRLNSTNKKVVYDRFNE